MNKKYVAFTGFLIMLYVTLSSDINGPAQHGHGNVTGAPSATVGHCQTSSCHGGNNALNIVQLQVIDTTTLLPVTTYNALQTYQIALTGDATAITTSLPGFGFQVSAVLGNHTQAGTFGVPASLASSIHTWPCGSTTVIEHNVVLPAVTSGVNKYSVKFYWTAPTAGSDSVSFYSLLNAVDGDGGSGGDNPNAAPRVTIYENSSTKVTQVNATAIDFSVYPNPAVGNTTISYSLASPGNVSIDIHDITGKTVQTLVNNELQNSGTHQYQPVINKAGMYLIRLVSNGTSTTHQFIKQ